jgi:hypothetical protein
MGNPASLGQQTRAGQIIVAGAAGNGMRGTTRKRKASRKTAARRAPRSAAKRANRGGRARLVKGSAAAKAYMAKIRRKRRK